jgi:hypothetical protein
MTGSEPESPTAALLDGRYRLLECVGTGGMSRVHRAEDVALGRIVAIKLVADMEGDAADRARGEVAVLASLSHPSLVTLFDARIGEGQDYLVMEYVNGPTLSRLLQDGPLSPSEAAALASDLASGLHAVHRAGIVHRDVKPSNVLLASTDAPGRRFHAKLGDFGIAYLLESDRMTSPGLVMGTAAYLAPEQARGEAPTPAADIYALGLVLIEALSGAPAFPRATPMESIVARQTMRPTIPGSIPPGWAALLGRMTAPDPAHRPSAAEVAHEAAALADPSRQEPDPGATMPLTAADAAGLSGTGLAAAGLGAAGLGAAGLGAAGAAASAATTVTPVGAGDAPTAALPQSRSASGDTATPPPARPRRRRTALILTGATAAVVAAGLGAWALSGADPTGSDPTRTVAPALQTERPSTTTPPSQDPAEAPVVPADSVEDDDEADDKAEQERRKAEEEKRKAAEKAQKDAEKAAEEQRKAEEKAQEEAEDQAEETTAPTTAPVAPTVPPVPPTTEQPAP